MSYQLNIAVEEIELAREKIKMALEEPHGIKSLNEVLTSAINNCTGALHRISKHYDDMAAMENKQS